MLSKVMSGRGGETKRGRGRGRGRGAKDGRGRGQADEYEPERLVPRKRGLFSRDLSEMMHGFGDGKPPFTESVEHVEEMCVDYITAVMQKATELATLRDVKVTTEDIMFVMRKDTKKYERAKELLQKDKEIKAAKKDMDFDERTLAKEEGD